MLMLRNLYLASNNFIQKRNFWAWLNIVFNYVDESRIKEVGPDIACAEWLLRNGAYVKWVGSKTELQDYNQVPKCPKGKYIQEINATESSIMSYGFDHFIGCKHIEAIRFHKSTLIDDKAMAKLEILKNTLTKLEIISCGNVTDKGLLELIKLKNLKYLKIENLPYIKSPEETINCMKRELCNCNICYS
ncbi:ATP synthase subunit s, mitochondrial-like [Ctenocephalides felis]|uniref:ATP synthase subunit s, mitochondrial-like n=1 Tax=Ctenocephalides felis TaxID=7515 RepID=UPI000E6E1A30|nr:ATP synthase subunit s, mitochondrial-like [Ctenocephalides felis]